MTKLTKKECIEAYNNLDFKLCELEEKETGVDVYCLYDADLEKFAALIEEHFNEVKENDSTRNVWKSRIRKKRGFLH